MSHQNTYPHYGHAHHHHHHHGNCTKCSKPKCSGGCDPCQQTTTGCIVNNTTNCISYSGNDLTNIGFLNSTTLNSALTNLNAIIGGILASTAGSSNVIQNVGVPQGRGLYKGLFVVSGTPTHQFRAVKGDASIDVGLIGTDLLEFSVNPTWLSSQLGTVSPVNLTSTNGSVILTTITGGYDLAVPPVTVESTDNSITVSPTATGVDLALTPIPPVVEDTWHVLGNTNDTVAPTILEPNFSTIPVIPPNPATYVATFTIHREEVVFANCIVVTGFQQVTNTSSLTLITTLPVGYRPTMKLKLINIAWLQDNATLVSKKVSIWVDTNGEVSMQYVTNDATDWIQPTQVFVLDLSQLRYLLK